jgi:nucleoside 2-deoxyribosyltransferase|tara:strand:- start:1708 stop:2121 length:414 start_codon:yes stop_codon:yes gene_type:complete
MRIFITATFKEGENKEEIGYLCSLIRESGFQDFCFIRDVENYKKVFDNPKDLMKRAKEEISKSDVLLIDMSNKPTGRAIEAGIAFDQNKKIISIMKKGTKIKDTTKGISNLIIEYETLSDIVKPLNSFYIELNKTFK